MNLENCNLLKGSVFLQSENLAAEVCPFGATLRRLIIRSRDPSKHPDRDVVLGYRDLRQYQADTHHLGGIVGRFANRIANGTFQIEEGDRCYRDELLLSQRELQGLANIYQLNQNQGLHCLHGGKAGFDAQSWQLDDLSQSEASLVLHSTDGDQGFPGSLEARVTYTLSDSQLRVSLWARSTQITPVNMTTHAYFNLDGVPPAGTLEYSLIDSHSLLLHAMGVQESTDERIPTGRILPIQQTIFGDFVHAERPLGELCADHHLTLIAPKEQWAASEMPRWRPEKRHLAPFAMLHSADRAVSLEVHSTMPGMQIYTAQFLEPKTFGKDQTEFGPRSAICFENSFFPDCVNHKHWPSCFLAPEQSWNEEISFKLSWSD